MKAKNKPLNYKTMKQPCKAILTHKGVFVCLINTWISSNKLTI